MVCNNKKVQGKMSKTKIIGIRVKEELVNRYSSLPKDQKEKFKIEVNELLSKYLNEYTVNTNTVNTNTVNSLYSESFNPKKVQVQLKTSKYNEDISLDELLSSLEEDEK